MGRTGSTHKLKTTMSATSGIHAQQLRQWKNMDAIGGQATRLVQLLLAKLRPMNNYLILNETTATKGWSLASTDVDLS
eukprot:SAG31_NODE_42523_length_271_cov_0.604651_1_plen_77_part_01